MDAVLPIRVVVADDEWTYADALAAALSREADISVVATAYSAEEAVQLSEKHEPAVLLLDLNLPDADGIDVCERLAASRPEIAIVIVTGETSDESARRSIAAGARAYIVKQDRGDPRRVADAIRGAADGRVLYLDRDLQPLLRKLAQRAPNPAVEAGLTPRELEVIEFVAEGLLYKQIGLRLSLAEQTIKNHVREASRKLGVSNRMALVARARNLGIIGDQRTS